ncbi:MAG TPA: NAD(P)H-dependent oxidoreductase subunit E [Dongiaceae bacterium]|nr:NAD(P)H-dependent oxidoreductase subunit E [Dongiaceae bacterium]
MKRHDLPKGRIPDTRAQNEISELLGGPPYRRDLLIEYLHAVQDRYGCISLDHIAALAAQMRLAQTEVYEVATFYAHFDVTAETRPRRPVVRVCQSLSCALAGGAAVLASCQADPHMDARPAPCMGACDKAPACMIEKYALAPATAETITDHVTRHRFAPSLPAYQTAEAYREAGGYAMLEKLRRGDIGREELLATLSASQLRGLGGAGFPSVRKWQLVMAQPKPRLLAVNADEGEPGTFKDRYYLEREPHRFLEGLLIAAWAIEAEDIYIYLRDEYPALHMLLAREIATLAEAPRIHLRRGAGAYICGEESAMLESLEGKRGLPRHKPPFPGEVGLFGRPTLVHNVETLFWLPTLLERGAEWFTRQGHNGRVGLRSFSVSGRVRSPGVKLAPAGITARALIEDYCEGMADGHVFHAYLPGGASGGILPAALADVPLDFGTLEPHGCFIGSAALIVLSDKDDLAMVAHNLMQFFAEESCGQCTPCRNGTEKALGLLGQESWDKPLLTELAHVMGDASICGLGQAACNPVKSILRYFPEVGA